MKQLSLLFLALAFVLTGCSKDEIETSESPTVNLVTETGTPEAAPTKVSLTGNQDVAIHARLQSNGNAAGFWKDNVTGVRVKVECMYLYEDGMGSNALLTGTVTRGPQAGMSFALRVVDGQNDGLSVRIPTYQNCEEINPLYLFPMPITSGNVKID